MINDLLSISEAKKLIEETKAKMEEREQQEAEEALSGESAKGGDVPFFAGSALLLVSPSTNPTWKRP